MQFGFVGEKAKLKQSHTWIPVWQQKKLEKAQRLYKYGIHIEEEKEKEEEEKVLSSSIWSSQFSAGPREHPTCTRDSIYRCMSRVLCAAMRKGLAGFVSD